MSWFNELPPELAEVARGAFVGQGRVVSVRDVQPGKKLRNRDTKAQKASRKRNRRKK